MAQGAKFILRSGIAAINRMYPWRKFPELKESTRRELEERFKPEIEQLERLLGREIEEWKRD